MSLRLVVLTFVFAIALSSPAPAASWDELTSDQRELFRQAVEEGGTKWLSQPVTPAGRQMYNDISSDPSDEVRRLFFIMRQKAGQVPRPKTLEWIDLQSSPYNLVWIIGSGERKKWYRFRVDPAPSQGPLYSPYGLKGVDRCGYLSQLSGSSHNGFWETPYTAGQAVPLCPDRTVALQGYNWSGGTRANEDYGPTAPEDGYVLTKADGRTTYYSRLWYDSCGFAYSEPPGYQRVTGGGVSGCVGNRLPNCTGDDHACYPHSHGVMAGYFKEDFGQILAEGSGNPPVIEGEVRRTYGDEPGDVDRLAIDREMRRPKNQPLVDWLHARFLDERLKFYAPRLHYDIQEGYTADSAEMATDNHVPGQYANKLLDWNGGSPITLASADPADPADHLYLNYLGPTYPNGTEVPYHLASAPGGHLIDIANSYSADVQRMHLEDRYRDRMYGRVWDDPNSDNVWLQYWFFYYKNEGSFGIGDHEGDWEMIQIKLDASGTPVHATYAQHGGAGQETCAWDRVPKYTVGGGLHPVVYVEVGSHASLFVPRGVGHTDGNKMMPRMSQISDANPRWVMWPGLWGASETVVRSPGYNGANRVRWVNPPGFDVSTDTCPGGASGQINPARKGRRLPVGRATLERPRVSARRSGRAVRVRYSVPGITRREARRAAIQLSVHARGRRFLPTSVQFPLGAPSGTRKLRLPLGKGPYTVRASVRHRGEHSRIATGRVR